MKQNGAKHISRWLLLAIDIALLVISLYIAKLMRGGLVMSYIKDAGDRVWRYAPYAPLFIANHVAWLWLMGAYRVMWMYEELKDMAKLAVACVLATLINLGINAVFAIGYSRYVLGFLGVFGLVLVITSRYLLLLTHNIMYGAKSEKQVKRALIIGADAEGIKLVKALPTLDDGARHEAAAFLDEDVDKLYRRIGSLPVDGMYLDAAKVISLRRIDEVITTRKTAASPAFKSVYIEAAKAGCEVKVYSDGALDRVTLSDAVSSGSGEISDINALKADGTAIIGGGELALSLAQSLIINGVSVAVLSDNEKDLKALKRMGAKACIGSGFSAQDVSGFVASVKPGSVIYLAGVRDREVAEGNEEAAHTANTLAPAAALEAAKSVQAKAFVRLGRMLDLPEEEELLKDGEQAVLGAEAGSIRVSAVSISGLLCDGGLINRLENCAPDKLKIENCPESRMAFISVPQAAAAIINLLSAGLTGAFEIRGGQALDMAQLLCALGGEAGEKQEIRQETDTPDLSTAVKDVYVRALN